MRLGCGALGLGLAVLALGGAGAVDRAAAAPVFAPERESLVTYHVDKAAKGVPSQFDMLVAAGGGRLKLSSDALPFYFLVDRVTRMVTLVLDGAKMQVEVPLDHTFDRYLLLDPAIAYQQLGSERVIGRGCTDWQATLPQGHATLCMSDDGLILRAQGVDAKGGTGGIEATAVRLFDGSLEAPQGYSKLKLPNMQAAAAFLPGLKGMLAQ